MLRGWGPSIWRVSRRGLAALGQNNVMVRAKMHENDTKAFLVDDTRVYTYGDFLKVTGRYVTVLSEQYGIGKGDRVLARTTKTVDGVAMYFACLQMGAIYIPVNPVYTTNETSYYIKDSDPKLMITCDEKSDMVFRDRVPNVVREDKLMGLTKRAKPTYDVENVRSNDIACVCYTSGTTGLPKGAMLTHSSISTNALHLVDLWRFRTDDKLLHTLPFYHVHGMFISLNCSLFSHSTVLFRDHFNVDDVLKHMSQCSVMMGVPTYYTRILQSGRLTRDHYRHMRLFVSGSAPLSLAAWDDFKQETGHTILERYGMTEAGVICSNPYEESSRRPGSVGRAIPGTKVRLSESGGIEIKTDCLFAGYWKNPARTEKEFTDDGYYKTGDVGRIDDDDFLFILGRSKDLVISGGMNVYPKEIEDVVDKIPGVAESAVIGVPHPDLGEAAVAVVALVDDAHDDMEDTILFKVREKLASYKTPKRVIFMPSLPRNSMAKVQKNVLREQFKEAFQYIKH